MASLYTFCAKRALRITNFNLSKINKNLLKRPLSTIKFAKSHEYIKLEGDVGTVGITEHAASLLGDVVFVELPEVGSKYLSGDTFGSVESVKAASDVYAPVEGEIIEVNSVGYNN